VSGDSSFLARYLQFTDHELIPARNSSLATKQFSAMENIVTYSGFSIHDATLLHSKSRYTTVKHSRQLSEHTYTSDPHGLGTLTPILAVRKLPNTRRDNPSSGYRSTCTPQRHLGVYIINLSFTSPDYRMSSLERFSNHTEPMSVEVRRLLIPYLWRCLSIVYSVTMLLVYIVIHQSHWGRQVLSRI
jgi:hypothetical protein